MTASVAVAGSSRQNPPSKAARAKAAKPSSRSAKPTAKVKPAVKAIATEEGDEPVAAVEPVKALPIPASALLMQYQRVGRDLMLLSNERQAQIGVETEDAKLSCAELQDIFRSIKINDAVKTAESRVTAAAVLADLHDKIKRLRGVAVSQDCLNNPLAKDCT